MAVAVTVARLPLTSGTCRVDGTLKGVWSQRFCSSCFDTTHLIVPAAATASAHIVNQYDIIITGDPALLNCTSWYGSMPQARDPESCAPDSCRVGSSNVS